jgi:hypothetical protein
MKGSNLLCTLKNCRKLSTKQKNMKPLRLITISSSPST